jgi:hypothetical protein
MSSGTIVPAIDASGVGYWTWNRTSAAIVPSRCSRSKTSNEPA